MNSTSSPRPLEGISIGISVAAGEDIAALGLTAAEVSRNMVRLSEALLAAGAHLVFGHDWRPDGVMQAIGELAARHQSAGSSGVVITNLVPWPNVPSLDAEMRRGMEERGLLRIEEAGLPGGVAGGAATPALRALALSHLRRRLAQICQARICLGGKVASAEGFFAGIIEEAWTCVTAGRPLFVSRFLGGASAVLADALTGKAGSGSAGFLVLPGREEDYAAAQTGAPWLPPANLFADFNPPQIQEDSGLDPAEWLSLTGAGSVDRFAALVIRGLARRTAG